MEWSRRISTPTLVQRAMDARQTPVVRRAADEVLEERLAQISTQQLAAFARDGAAPANQRRAARRELARRGDGPRGASASSTPADGNQSRAAIRSAADKIAEAEQLLRWTLSQSDGEGGDDESGAKVLPPAEHAAVLKGMGVHEHPDATRRRAWPLGSASTTSTRLPDAKLPPAEHAAVLKGMGVTRHSGGARLDGIRAPRGAR